MPRGTIHADLFPDNVLMLGAPVHAGAGPHDPLGRLTGDLSDEVEVGVVVEEGQAFDLSGGGDQ